MGLDGNKKSILSYVAAGIVVGALIVFSLIKPVQDESPVFTPDKVIFYEVEKVIDGDTIKLAGGEVVRLIGIDAPESHHPEVPVQVFSQEAYEFVKQLCEGFEARLEYDEERKGKYGRTLAYVYLKDGRMLNEELIKRGYAYVLTRFPFRKKSRFLKLQDAAREEQRGLWSYNLSCARLTGIVERFNKLSEEGKRKFDIQLDRLIDKYEK
ncbi:MAG: thermonuclease family protein [Candidatus Omnitrophica bacterium]|nr:thermonuclease family protein [Candidatus Omnitrophota bacterium]